MRGHREYDELSCTMGQFDLTLEEHALLSFTASLGVYFDVVIFSVHGEIEWEWGISCWSHLLAK